MGRHIFRSSFHNVISENNIVGNMENGVYIRTGGYNKVIGNMITQNGQSGINISGVILTIISPPELLPSINNTVAANTISLNLYGIALKGGANYNTIVNNTLAQNSYGIFLSKDQYSTCVYFPTGNKIYHNNFIGNTVLQAYDEGANTFDNGYPSGGNYWSNYTGTDEFTGPYQNETGSDGIGDTPYIINIDSQDNYPLMNANSWEPFTMLAVMEKLSEFDTPNNFLNPKNVNTVSTIALIMLVGFINASMPLFSVYASIAGFYKFLFCCGKFFIPVQKLTYTFEVKLNGKCPFLFPSKNRIVVDKAEG